MSRRKKGQKVDGWVILDKPLEMTSTQAVAVVRRIFDAQKAGHGGTLDPLATGILPIALGEATKTVPYVMDGAKTYRFTAKWGEATTTDDREGDVIARSDRRPTRAEIEAVLPQFTGSIDQVPPQFSAVKIGGERAYDLRREGETVALEARTIDIHDLTLIDIPDADHAVFEAVTGKASGRRGTGSICGRLASVRRVGCPRFPCWFRRTPVITVRSATDARHIVNS